MGRRAAPARDREAEREAKLLNKSGGRRSPAPLPKAENTEIIVSEGTTVKDLADKLGIKANSIIKVLFEGGMSATINQPLDFELITDLCKKFGATAEQMTYEEEAVLDIDLAEAEADFEPRAPVVTVMGHVDHGKTSLLDAIRKTNIADREAGGITQAIGASNVKHGDSSIVFIDTPGHQAFTQMRARGAQVTDVVVLVVAADDGVMPQTLEAIDHAKASGENVQIIVAINKMDKAGATPDRVKQQLSDRGLVAEEWGGDTVMVPVSAKSGEGIPQLLEMIQLVTELKELRANPNRPAIGTVLEAKLDRGKGPVATLLVQNGTLKVGDHFLVGSVFGRVRALVDDRGKRLKQTGPSTAVVVLGLEDLPVPGDPFQVATDVDKAKKISESRVEREREKELAKNQRISLEQLHEQLRAGEVKELPVVLKADVQGSMEVLQSSLEKLVTDKVRAKVIHAGVGAISESDVLLSTAVEDGAIIIGFNVRPERTAAVLAEREGIDIRLHTVIYELIDEMKAAMTGLLEPVFKENVMGRADVLETFRVTKVGTIAGCVLQEGRVDKNSRVRLLRDNIVIHTGKVSSLRRFKDDVSEVRAGQECGIGIENYNDVKKGDQIESFTLERVEQKLFAETTS